MKNVQKIKTGREEKRAEYIQGLFNTIIPPGCIGEQYADDVALIFKVKKALVQTKTKYQKVDIVETDYWGKILFLDNLLMKTDKDGHIINEMIVHPIMLTGSKKKNVLVVGGGEGFTATELLKYPYIERIDVIDIDGEFVEICKKIYPEKMACLKDPRVNLIIQDGLKYLRQTNEIYDAIFTTPTDPLTISDPLFIKEYFDLCHKHLSEDGIYETDAYMPFYKYGNVDYAYIRKALAEFFPISKIYTCTVPTFPGGLFSFGFASKKWDPEKDYHPSNFKVQNKYYNSYLHFAAFKLPQFMLDRIEEENKKATIQPLTKELFKEAVELVLKAGLDTKEEIEHHLQHINAHYIALDKDRVIGVIGWYQDNVNYAAEAMGDKFPGEKAYWVGFFAVDDKYRGQGMGYALLKELEKVIKEKGAGELWVSSVPETKEYYQRQGFKIFMQGKIGGNTKFFCVKKLT